MKFREKIYKTAAKIPRGKVTTYKALAHAINSKAYRAVGTAMNKNPHWPKVSCHRVINSDGRVGGFAEQFRGREKSSKSVTRAKLGVSGVKKKIALLRKECVEVINGKIDLKRFRYKL